jgi:hypothetical protein
MSDFSTVGAAAAFFAILFFPGPFVWAPALIFCVQKLAAHPRTKRFDGDLSSLPAAPAEYFVQARDSLAADGFETAGMYFLPNAAPNVTCLLMLAVNRHTDESALAAAVYATANGATTLKSMHVEFASRYSNGQVVGTGNCKELGCFAKIPGFDTVQFSRVVDLRLLYRLHAARCNVILPGGRRINRLDGEFGGDGEAYINAVLAEEFARQVPVGYLRLDGDGEQYRPTVKGACLMTWKNLWPVKQIRMRSHARKAARWTAELLSRDALATRS